MRHTTTPYEAALRLRVGYGKAVPKEGESEDSPYRRRTLRPDGTPDWHIMIVLEGRYIICPDDDMPVTLSPGQAVLYPPHMRQDSMLHRDYQSGRTFWAHFFPEISMLPFLQWPASGLGPSIIKWDGHETLNRQILGACDRCVEYFDSTYIRNRSLSLLVLEELLRLIYQVHPDNRLDHLDNRVATALQYIAQNITAPLSAKSIAGAIGLSASRFSHIFAVNMNCGPMEYVEKQRISMAKSMLANSEAPVSFIAEKCGFTSPYYFSKRFRKNNKLSPSEYRRKAHQQGE
ncbi:MAG: helix-turn-helix transcriptional regulator [Akkermansiaceae bacterium]|nr:helix-turn-helix transcriptional regulator [Akkermansiaceae bacterium]